MFGWLSRRQDAKKDRQDQKVRKESLARLHREYQDAKLEIFVALIPRIEQQRADYQPFADSIAAFASHSMTGEDSTAVGEKLNAEHRAYAGTLATHFMSDSHLRSVAVRGAHALSRHKVEQALESDDADFRRNTGREVIALMKKPLEHGTGPKDRYLATEAEGYALAGDFAEAHDAAADAIAINLNNGDAWRAMGDAFRGLGKPDEALDCYQKVKILDPDAAGLDDAIADVSSARSK
ncbi:MAG: tetratricopeptide repeat protein [Vulcanimicrobiaceae bacterium]